MQCKFFKDVSYGSGIYCNSCGMDIGFSPIKKHKNGKTYLYCCEDCEK